MTEEELLERWAKEKAMYDAWGACAVHEIRKHLADNRLDLDQFLKIPATHRLKAEASLLDKAFYRKKAYDDPYGEIEDKVGARFVVLLLEDIDMVCEAVTDSEIWAFEECRHFLKEKEDDPLIFTYQSVHYVVRANADLNFDGVQIESGTPCEIQIRTLLQHAYAELTHDAIYKTSKIVKPAVHRTVAKSMALIETTDGFFGEVVQKLDYGPVKEHSVIEMLDSLFLSLTGFTSHNEKSSLLVWDQFEDSVVDGNLINEIQDFLNDNDYVIELIKEKYSTSAIYRQSTILFIYWMLKKHRNLLLDEWPLRRSFLEPLASDLGVSLE